MSLHSINHIVDSLGTGRPGSSEVPRNPLNTLGREFDPGKRDFSH